MATNCEVKTNMNDDKVAARRSGMETYIASKLNEFMGTRAEIEETLLGQKHAKEALKAYDQARKDITNLLADNMEIVGIEHYNIDDYTNLLGDYLQSQFKVFGGQKLFVGANERRILAASRLISKLTKLHKTRYGKKLSAFERAFLPVNFFARKIDRFGFIAKYIRQATNVIEDSKRSGSRHKNNLKKIHAKYIATIDNIAGSLEFIPKEMVMDGLNLVTADGKRVVYLGSRKVQGIIKHDVRDELTGKQEVLASDQLSRDRISHALANKYAFEFSNDVMAGQARNIVWRNLPSDEHKEEISHLLNKMDVKIQKTKDIVAKNASDAKADLAMGFDGIYEMKDGKGRKYTYVVLKDIKRNLDPVSNAVVSEHLVKDEIGGERYSAYIIRHKDADGKAVNYFKGKFPEGAIDVESAKNKRGSIFADGWVKAKEQKVFGRRVFRNKQGGLFVSGTSNEKGFNFNNISSLRMRNQPNSRLMIGAVSRPKSGILGNTAEKTDEFKTFWTMVNDLRRTYNQIGDELLKESNNEQVALQRWVNNRLPGLMKNTGKVMTKKDTDAYFKSLNQLFGLNKRFYTTNEGNIVTPNVQFLKQRDNYTPFVFEPADTINMMEDGMAEIEVRMRKLDPGSEDYKILERRRQELQLAYARITDDLDMVETLEQELNEKPDELISRMTVADRAVYTKHRQEWTDIALRKKDPEVIDQYIDSIYYNLTKNRLMVSMLETASTILGSGMPSTQKNDLMFWLMNRTKISLNDPTAWAGIGKWDYSYVRIARLLNKWVPGNRRWNEESVRKMINFSKGSLSAMLLGHSGALTNRTQIINPAIGAGWDMVWKSARILRDKDETFSLNRANAIISHVGTDEVTNMLEDVLSHGGALTLDDAGLVSTPFFRLPIPTRTWTDFLSMVRKNRQRFVDKGIPEIDLMLRRIELDKIRNTGNRIETKEREILAGLKSWNDKRKVGSTLKMLEREYNRVTAPSERRSIEQLRENYLDLLMTPKKELSRKNIERKYRKIMGDVSENRMRRMVAWKLGWWWDGFAPELFTFTESERFMRKQTVIIALLNAKQMGLLGAVDPTKTTEVEFLDRKTNRVQRADVPDIFLTDEAVRIARNAVADTMFGMSQNNLGEAFGGFGAQLGLYKAYGLNQMIHDYKILETYMNGNVTRLEAVQRLTDALMTYLKLYAERFATGKKFEYDPTAPGMDHEAMAMVRFLLSRVTMSAFSIFTELFTILRSIFKTPLASQFNAMIRGGENPVIGLALRLGTNALIMATMDPGDENEDLLDVGWDFLRLILPVFLTLPMHMISTWD